MNNPIPIGQNICKRSLLRSIAIDGTEVLLVNKPYVIEKTEETQFYWMILFSQVDGHMQLIFIRCYSNSYIYPPRGSIIFDVDRMKLHNEQLMSPC